MMAEIVRPRRAGRGSDADTVCLPRGVRNAFFTKTHQIYKNNKRISKLFSCNTL